MTSAIGGFNRLATTWAGLAWAVTWQSALLVGVFAMIALAMRRSSPALRYGLWQVAAIKLLVMPLWGIAIALPDLPRRAAGLHSEAGPHARPSHEPGARLGDRARSLGGSAAAGGRPLETEADRPRIARIEWPAWLLVGWGLVVAGQVAANARQRNRLERLLRRCTPAGEPALLELVAELSDRIGLRRPPEVLIADDEGSPFVCGLRRPALVLPRGLAGSLDPDSLRAVLVHELAHLRRRDLVWDWIPAIARILYFFHPAAHYVAYRARLERELACDQAAMVLTGQRADGYASTLIEVASRASALPSPRAAIASARLDGGGP
jgi:Zn-dependent protease with chaperone function